MAVKKSNKKVDVYELITNQIIEKLEARVIPWQMPWNGCRNGVTGKEYRGLNALLLANKKYSSPNYYTFNQISKLGGKIRKGEKSHLVTYWKFFKLVAGAKNMTAEELDDAEGKVVPMIKYYRVFNYEQCENMPAEKEIKKTDLTPIEAAEEIISNYSDCPAIQHGKNRAYYNYNDDFVNLPTQGNFKSIEEYYSTLFHELTHSTGHKKRLNRVENRNFDSVKERAFEELIAELGASFLCGMAGIEMEVLDNSASYIDG
ncbi:zincin-like metallopeptidase domain-containing protein [Lentisphaerota bacterium WC36G]|nr:ssDNA-binding domain-containing protein [Lentisphaerae bacterium WC36]UDQ99378.1 ssDNA-binding domain-containing protein [Lentisphaerae bacterium WC36]